MFEPINFNNIREFSEGKNTVVIVALSVKEGNEAETVKGMTEFFKNEMHLISGDVIDIHHIEGNVLGKDGRSDYLLELSSDCRVDPVTRICDYPDMKWTEDYLVNYRQDYK